MERTISVEEKIKRAEEIYARRHEQENRNTATFYLNGKEKKDIKLFKKMILQMVVCLLIYLIVYTIRNNDYIFSDDFIKKANELLSIDTNFVELYENVNNAIFNFFNNTNEQEEDNREQEDIQKEDINQENIIEQTVEENIGGGNEEVRCYR